MALRKLRVFFSFAFVAVVAAGLGACGGDDGSSSRPAELLDDVLASVDDLGDCTAKKVGDVELVGDTSYVCAKNDGKYKWQEVSQTEDEPESSNSGKSSSSSGKKTESNSSKSKSSDSGKGVKSSSSGKSSSVSSSSEVRSSSSKPSSFSVGDDRSVYDAQNNTLTDYRDGQVYRTVSIGTQTWMAQNLNYAYTGVPFYYEDENITSDSTSWCYDNDPANCTKYGRLYTWAAAMDSVGTWSTNGKGCGDGKTCMPTYPVRGICPEGWHLPTQAEWNALFNAVGGKLTAGKKLKFTSGWYNNGNGKDAYAFSALPAGYRAYYDGGYKDEGGNANFWSSIENGNDWAYLMYLGYDLGNADLVDNHLKSLGYSVRCLKDDSNFSVTPQTPAAVDPATVVKGALTDSRDGQTYKTVTIGTQTWMAENLNYVYTDVSLNYGGENSDSTSWCYDNDPSNCTKYGRLYTWASAVGKSENECGFDHTCYLPEGNVRGVCPEGWHLPTQVEWETLFTAVDGSGIAGAMLKSTSGWYNNGNGTDAYGFSALPAGFSYGYGFYADEGKEAYFWSPMENDSCRAYYVELYYNRDGAFLGSYSKSREFSVRCVKD